MRSALAVVLVTTLSACHAFLPTAPVWNHATGEVDCSIGSPLKATALAVVAGVFAAGSIRGAGQPPPPNTYDQYGYPTNNVFTPGAELDRAVGYAFAGAAAMGVVASAINWTKYAQCHRASTRLQAVLAAPDCASIARRAHELAALDPELHDTVVASDARIATCLAATVPRGATCTAQRDALVLRAHQSSDADERMRILTSLPNCASPPAGSDDRRLDAPDPDALRLAPVTVR